MTRIFLRVGAWHQCTTWDAPYNRHAASVTAFQLAALTHMQQARGNLQPPPRSSGIAMSMQRCRGPGRPDGFNRYFAVAALQCARPTVSKTETFQPLLRSSGVAIKCRCVLIAAKAGSFNRHLAVAVLQLRYSRTKATRSPLFQPPPSSSGIVMGRTEHCVVKELATPSASGRQARPSPKRLFGACAFTGRRSALIILPAFHASAAGV